MSFIDRITATNQNAFDAAKRAADAWMEAETDAVDIETGKELLRQIVATHRPLLGGHPVANTADLLLTHHNSDGGDPDGKLTAELVHQIRRFHQ